MSARVSLVLAALLLVLSLGTGPAEAHESRPLYVELSERGGGLFAVQWRTPPSVRSANLPAVTLFDCEVASPVGTARGSAGPISQRLYRCGHGLGGATLGIAYPLHNPSVSTLLRIRWSSGEIRSLLAGPEETAIALPTRETGAGVALEYLALGIEHIFGGFDHLLFVACLVMIAGTLRRMLIAITGFTVAHSVTLALAALGLVRVPIPPVEAVIALSVVFLASELARDSRETLTWRHPIAVAGSFGLLHGFGFASVLSEIGLPQTEIPLALLFFNLGVEAGQVAFVIALVCAAMLLRRLAAGVLSAEAAAPRLQNLAAYAVGSVASFWLIDRIAGFWA